MIVINRLAFSRTLVSSASYSFSKYKYPYNINREEGAGYLKKVEKAQKMLQEAEKRIAVPRRQRRVYDRPKYDTDISNYTAWRIYDPRQMFYKFWPHGAPVAAKLYLQPKWLIHAFGLGLPPMNHEKSASLEFSFQDSNFSKFLLYEYRNTTFFKPNVEGYDYDNQQNIPVRQRLTRRLSFEQFWQSEERFEFRLNCSAYAQKFKFKKWIEQTLEASKTKESYEDFINKKFGPVITYNKKEDVKHYQFLQPAVLNLTPLHYNLPKKGEKLKAPQVELPKRQKEQHRIMRKRTETPVKEKQAADQKNN